MAAKRTNFSVDKVSSMLLSPGLTAAMNAVKLLPPSESLSIKVSLLSLYGMCACPLASAITTCPSKESDLLMVFASLRDSPDV